MSQQQPERPRPVEQQEEAVKYGDVFAVSGELASKVVAPRDASMMQTAENAVFGQTQKGGPASAMQAAATANEKAGFVGHDDVSDAVETMGVNVTETELPTARFVTHSVGGQVVGQFVQATPVRQGKQAGTLSQAPSKGGGRSTELTIGEALEAVAATTGDKPVEQSDAAAIQAAEVRATGSSVITHGGLASSAQSAASMNAQIDREDMIKLSDVLTNATLKLPADKEATRDDAEGVMSAEQRNNNPEIAAHRAGVAASMLAAARLNEGSNT